MGTPGLGSFAENFGETDDADANFLAQLGLGCTEGQQDNSEKCKCNGAFSNQSIATKFQGLSSHDKCVSKGYQYR